MKSANPWEICIPYVVHFFLVRYGSWAQAKRTNTRRGDADAVIISVLDMPVLLS